MNRSTLRRTFRCFIHPRPATFTAGPCMDWQGQRLPTLDGANFPPVSFPIGYDDVAALWSAIEGMHLEPDGSFAWVGRESDDCPDWRLEGQLTDGGKALAVVELIGHCGAEQMDQLLRPLGWPELAVVFQLRDLGVFIDEQVFRQQMLSPARVIFRQ